MHPPLSYPFRAIPPEAPDSAQHGRPQSVRPQPATSVLGGNTSPHDCEDYHDGGCFHPALLECRHCEIMAFITADLPDKFMSSRHVTVYTNLCLRHLPHNHMRLERIQGTCRGYSTETCRISETLRRPEKLANLIQTQRLITEFAHGPALVDNFFKSQACFALGLCELDSCHVLILRSLAPKHDGSARNA